MNNSLNIHWTRDPELLGQFVLHRLDDARRKELEAHLLTCDECQKAVRDEQQLVLGIKRVGRDEMKARLKERLSVEKSIPSPRTAQSVPWVRIVGVAATFVVLFGLGVYNKWIPLGTEQTEQEGISEQKLEAQTGADEAGEETTQPAPSDDAMMGKAPERKQAEALRTETPAKRRAESQRDEAERQETKRDLRLLESPVPSAAGAPVKEYDMQAGELQGDVRMKDDARPQIWVDGVVITSKRPADDFEKVTPMAAPTEEAVRAAPQAKSELRQKTNAAAVTVTELPVEELPRTQQMKQQRLDQNTVQTLIEQQNGNLNFTLYRQTPQQKQKTQNATVEQVGADSLIIFIDGEQIGYKIRGGLDALQQTKTKK